VAVAAPVVRVRAVVRPEELSRQVDTRAEPLPEEAAVERGDEDRHGAAAEILRDSEERVAGADDGRAPADGADEHRASDAT
jgi:hypothetical protein